jgi:hypothetical protein
MYSARSDIVAELVGGDGGEANPYIPALRTLTGLRLALERVDPTARFGDHVLIAALPKVINPRYDLVHIVVSRRPISDSERERFLGACQQLGFVALYPDDEEAVEPGDLYARIATDRDLSAVAAGLPFSIWPATDDRPFQYALDVSHLGRALERGQLFELLAGNPLVSLGLSIGILAALLTLTPLLVSSQRMDNLRRFGASWRLLLYFACIGFAYMAVEIAALLRLQSFLGKPIYGLSVSLFAFLLASGLGSNLTGRLAERRLEASSTAIVLLLVGVGFVFAIGSAALFASTISWSLVARIAISVASIFPLAFLMGMLFPIGVRILARDSAELIPWAWAINGCFSVLGIFSTRIMALLFGFSRALMVGLIVYLLVMACVWAHARRGRPV